MTDEQPARIHAMLDLQAAQRGDALAIIDCDERKASWRDYSGMTEEAAAMLSRQGVCAGDRVVIVAETCLATAALIFAASRLDAWAVPVNARMTEAELARITDHAQPKLILYTVGVSREAAAHAKTAGARPFDLACGDLLCVDGAAGPSKPVLHGADQTAVILYTTGTTGDPKGVMLTHGNLLFAARASAELRQLVPEDRIYGALPLTHVFGLASMLMAATHVGAAIQFTARFKPAALYEALKSGVTVLPAVPQMHAMLMTYAAEHGHTQLDSDRLRYVSSGAAPLDPAWKCKAEAFYGIALQNGYGMTESTAGVSGTRNPIGSPDTSVGRPLPGVEVRLDESVGNEPGVGEVLTRGPHVMKGYYRNPVETEKALDADGWLRTGDLGRFDADGKLHIVGRSKELIIRGGFNIYPPEVEAAINDHPLVVQSAVVGRTVEGGNEEVVAFVQCAAGADLAEETLKAFIAERLSAYKRPSRIVVTRELPAAATGKILKHRLLAHFAAELRATEQT